ncbi:MAG: TOBE domain-containing protein, partial [Rhodanobacter sp.]
EFPTAASHGVGNGMDVTVAVRPERLFLTDAAGGAIRGRVDNIVYFGTDTTYQVALQDGVAVTVRAQNRDGARPRFAVGDDVGVDLAADALQVLRD